MKRMRSPVLDLATLLVFTLHTFASVVHVDVSHDGDVEVELNMEEKPSPRSERGQSGQAAYSGRKSAHVLEDFQVDLGYEIHGGVLADSGDFIKFKNIPYADPPLGDLRFLRPQYFSQENQTVNYGWNDNVCPQVQVGWVPKAFEFLNDFPDASALDDWNNRITPEEYGPVQSPPKNVSEDCLTLDVMVPKAVWDKRNAREVFKAAVVVWVHGGGFVYGWKDQYGSPEGLFNAANATDEQNVIYVAMNYRLGAFGWLGGQKYGEDGGYSNIGLLDQAFAVEWVENAIYLFGGDSRRKVMITMMGQSAGASSIMHHITAGSAPDKKPNMKAAIIQSPGFFPQPNVTKDDEMYKRFLNLSGAADLDALLTVDSQVLQDANAQMVHESMYGYFNFGPTIDNSYVEDLPGKILATRDVPVPAMLLGHMNRDGLLFTPPWIRTTPALVDYVQELFPGVPQSVLDMVASNYSVPTNSVPQLAILAVADFLDDIAIQCNSFYLTEASLKSTQRTYHPVYRYVFNSLPAIHGYDVGYTYYPSSPLIPPVDQSLAKFMQKGNVDFVRYLDPNPEDSTFWNIYTADTRKVMNMGDPSQSTSPDYSYKLGDDPMDRAKCEYWQSAPYYSPSTKSSDQQLVVQDSAHLKDL